MDRWDLSKAAGILVPALVLCLGAMARDVSDRPNILFFLVDDQRDDTLGCAGHPILKTPHIDGLAARGVRFRNAFVTTSICAASRASIFAGLYERTHGYTFGTGPMRRGDLEPSYPYLLRRAGYRTGFAGKFGVDAPSDTVEAMFDVFEPLDRNPYFKEMPDGSMRHETDINADRAIEFIRSTPRGRPFCMSVSFNAAHAEDNDGRPGIGHFPWPQSTHGMYEYIEIPPPRLGDPAIFESQPEFLRRSLNRIRYFWRWDTPEKYDANMRAYFRMIGGVDHAIGRVLEALRHLGLAEDTIVIYSADNGFYMGDRGFAGKWSHYEQSLRVPLIVYDPRLTGAVRGAVRDDMALNVDLAPTMLGMAGLPVTVRHQGRDLTPLLEGENPADWREDFFCEHLMNHPDIPKWEGVRGARYVYARYFEQDPPFEFLHDLRMDPDQLLNLADDSEYAPVLERMRARTDELRDRYAGAAEIR
jgi:arylsulfatase A-like enzyme